MRYSERSACGGRQRGALQNDVAYTNASLVVALETTVLVQGVIGSTHRQMICLLADVLRASFRG